MHKILRASVRLRSEAAVLGGPGKYMSLYDEKRV